MGKASAQITKTRLSLPVVLMLSVIPDIDIVIPFLEHRGPTHSIVMVFAVFIPVFVIYHKKALPYFLALIQHSLIGDYIAGGRTQLLWPLTNRYYGMGIGIKSQPSVAVEWTAFVLSMIIMLKTKDIARLFQPHNSNLILIIPTFTVLLPTFTSFPIDVPALLILPHLVYISVFSPSIVIDLVKILRNI